MHLKDSHEALSMPQIIILLLDLLGTFILRHTIVDLGRFEDIGLQ